MPSFARYNKYVQWHSSQEGDENGTAEVSSSSFDIDDRCTTLSPLTVEAEACPYCNKRIELDYDKAGSDIEANDSENTSIGRFVCSYCGWWQVSRRWTRSVNRGQFNYWKHDVYEGVLERFDVESLTVPLDALREHLRSARNDLLHVHPRQMELLVGAIFRDWFKCEVRHIGGPGDGGVDLYAVIGDKPMLVQVKRRSRPGTTEGVSTVRDLLGALVASGTRTGCIVTTAEQFSRHATDLAMNEGVRRQQIDLSLVAMNDLWSMLCITTPPTESPWSAFSSLD